MNAPFKIILYPYTQQFKVAVFIYLVVRFLLMDFNSDFVMDSTRTCNFLDVCVDRDNMDRFFKVSHEL